ncbi:MAG: UDP-3-O-(3-hydroxymyristoyl)glucosamine N-acyltransferase [Desulfobacter sp.]
MLTVQKTAEITGASLVSGNPGREISSIASFDDAGPGELTFADQPEFLSKLENTRAGAVLVPEGTAANSNCPAALLASPSPRLAFFKIVEHLFPKPGLVEGVHPSAVIGDNVSLGSGTCIAANATVGNNVVIGAGTHIMGNVYIGDNCIIGDDCEIKPNATLMERTRLGHRVIVHSGAVIGSDGYGFAQNNGEHSRLIHTGHVEIGNDVEIGACTTIDRGTLGVTRIGDGVKTDNQVHIAHNVKIGDNTLVVAQVGIAGSTAIGKNVIIAGKAGISGHLTIGDNAIVGPYAGVSANVPHGEIVSGLPHMPHKTWLKVANIISRLPGMRTKLLSLEKRIKKIEHTESTDTE